MDYISVALQQFGQVRVRESLSKHTTFKIGGPADYFLTIEHTDALVSALRYLEAEGVAYCVFGGGSNMLVSDEGFRGVVVHVKTQIVKISNSGVVEADAGSLTVDIAQQSMKAGLTGFEWGVGVPGTIGGAVRGNAGAMGKEMKDSVLSVDVYKDGEVFTFTNEECRFGYRHSVFKEQGGVVLRVRLQLTLYVSVEEQVKSKQQMIDFLQYRNSTQPKGFASTGCIFKNPDFVANEAVLRKFIGNNEHLVQFSRVGKISAGWLVEQSGMKGTVCGGAFVSEVHGNFVVSNKTASAADVRTLITRIQKVVYEKTGIFLEEEIQYIG